jgi:hypothetical protein
MNPDMGGVMHVVFLRPPKLIVVMVALCIATAHSASSEQPPGRSLGAIRLRSPSAGANNGTPVIDDHNLKELAALGRITEPAPAPEQPELDAIAERLASSAQELAEKRRQWRARYAKQVDLIVTCEHDCQLLEAKVGALWISFLRTKDSSRRNGVIAPKLEMTKQELALARARLEHERARLPTLLREARRDGAEPGWFRDLIRP